MLALIQRVREACVRVGGEPIGAIGPGLLVFVGVERGDGDREAERLIERVVSYRVFEDDAGRMNASLREHRGGLLLVPQFTLAADTSKGTRPSFTPAAPPEEGRRLFEHAVGTARSLHGEIASGRFGAHMQVSLVNDGPVTFLLRMDAARGRTGDQRPDG